MMIFVRSDHSDRAAERGEALKIMCPCQEKGWTCVPFRPNASVHSTLSNHYTKHVSVSNRIADSFLSAKCLTQKYMSSSSLNAKAGFCKAC